MLFLFSQNYLWQFIDLRNTDYFDASRIFIEFYLSFSKFLSVLFFCHLNLFSFNEKISLQILPQQCILTLTTAYSIKLSSYLSFLQSYLLQIIEWLTRRLFEQMEQTFHGLLAFIRRTETSLSIFVHRTPTHSHAISRSLACLAGITRNTHGSQFEFRRVEG